MGFSYKCSKEGVDLFNDIRGGIGELFLQLKREDNKNAERYDKALKDLVETIKTELFNVESNTDEFFDAYVEFFAKTSILAYMQRFDNDRDLEEFKREYAYSESELKEIRAKQQKVNDDFINEEEDFDSFEDEYENDYDISRYKINTDFNFGFDGIDEFVTATIDEILGGITDEESIDVCLESNLFASIRTISPQEYLEGGFIERDIQLIALFGESPKVNMVDEIINFFKEDILYSSIYETALESIMGVYTYLLQDGFGLREYYGVLSLKDRDCKIIDNNHRLARENSMMSTFSKLSSNIMPMYNVAESASRQFKVKEMLAADHSKPLYFPRKLLEYARCRRLTYKLSESVYKPYENINSWEEYAKVYVRPQMMQILDEIIYYAMEKHFPFKEVKSKVDDIEAFNSDWFKNFWYTNNGEVMHVLSSDFFTKAVTDDVQYCVKCMCCGVVVTDINTLGGKVNSIAVRIVDVNGTVPVTKTETVLKGVSLSVESYEDGFNISEGRKNATGSSILYPIIEFQKNYDINMSTAEPLFGYKAVELFIKRNRPIAWNNILLGEDRKRTPMFANIESQDAIPLQSNVMHNMMAGSRSGKGVMTMNILGSAIANNKPIFYVDRKPDMSVLFTELSNGSMFCVNGGQYVKKNDPRSTYSETGVGTLGWDMGYDAMPVYLKTALFPERRYEGVYGDFAYFRALHFMLCLIVARTRLSGTSHYEKLGGKDGIVIVIDEFKNWQQNFETSWLTPTGNFGNKYRISNKDREGYKKLKDELEVLDAELSLVAGNEVKVLKIQKQMESKVRAMNNLITPLKAYTTTVMDKFGETSKELAELLAAGFKDAQGALTDVFIIGQHIEYDGYDGALTPSGTYEQRGDGLFNTNERTKGKSLCRSIFDMFPHDWFMGRNAEKPSYMGASEKNSVAQNWLNEKSYWAYCNNTKMETLRTSAPSDAVYFKPYLVLNKHYEDDPNNPMLVNIDGKMVDDPDYTFINQCRNRVNDTAKTDLWSRVRLKHIPNEEFVRDAQKGIDMHYGALNPGIGFEGLASLMKMSNGLGEFVPSDLSKSGAIADYVAQCMGYNNYKELIFDFSPSGVFSSKDVVKAIEEPGSFQKIDRRLSIFTEFGLLNNGVFNESNADNISENADYNKDDAVVSSNSVYNTGYTEEVQKEESIYPQNVAATQNTPRQDEFVNDGWQRVNPKPTQSTQAQEQISEEKLREICRSIITTKARQKGKEISKQKIEKFCEGVINLLLKGGI